MPLGAAFNGEDLISSIFTPTVLSNSETLGNWKSTPIEPTSEVWRARMRSAPMAAM